MSRLILSRRKGEIVDVEVGGLQVTLTVAAITSGRVKLMLEGDQRCVKISRREAKDKTPSSGVVCRNPQAKARSRKQAAELVANVPESCSFPQNPR